MFSEEMRYDYPLTPDSWVMDVGVYMGDFTDGITRKYNCNVLGFEPITEFFNLAKVRFSSNPKVRLFNSGMAGKLMFQETFYKQHNCTSRYPKADIKDTLATEVCNVVCLKDFLAETGLKTVDLIKINCEGSEYELLEHMLEWGLQTSFKNIQVQFHDSIPSAAMRRDSIVREVGRTHTPTFCEPFVWENYRLK